MILKINEICSTVYVKTVYLYYVFELKFLYIYLFCGFFLLHVLITLFLAIICNPVFILHVHVVLLIFSVEYCYMDLIRYLTA